MTYLIIIFISPVYFIMRKDWLGFCINSVLFALAWLLLISIIGSFLSPLPWALAVGHASFAFRKQLMEEQATMIATKMAQAMRQSQTPPPQA